MTGVEIRRGFAQTELGQVHYAEAGEGAPVLFLHQTPRSWDEYLEVLPLVGSSRRAIAMDTLGFGDSCDPRGERIEDFAEGVPLLLDALGIPSASLVGHHTGGVVAIEVAASAPERVDRLILSSTPLSDATYKEAHQRGPGLDDAELSADGEHLRELWRQRQPYYPPDRPDLLDRFIVDALKSSERRHGGHLAIGAYEMESRLPLVSCPTLVLIGGADEHALKYARPLAERLDAPMVVVEGGTVPMPNHEPEAFAAAVLEFLDADD